jgi:hypothetical protein
MADQREFRLGIIGGCLSHQSDIPHSRLFHRQLDRMLQEGQGIRLKVAITRHFDRDYAERLEALLAEADVDGVLLHLRVVFVAKSVLLVNRLVEGRRHYRLHPFLFKQNETGWNRFMAASPAGQVLFASREPPKTSGDDEDPFDRPTPSKKVFGFRLRSLNLAISSLVGLDDWAISDEFAMFEDFKTVCVQRGIPFFILGPTPVTAYSAETILWRKMNRRISERFATTGFPFCLIEQLEDNYGNTMLRGDGFHLNKFGHTFIAWRLFDTMTSWIRKTLQMAS